LPKLSNKASAPLALNRYQKKLSRDTATPLLYPILMERKELYDAYTTEILVAISEPPD